HDEDALRIGPPRPFSAVLARRLRLLRFRHGAVVYGKAYDELAPRAAAFTLRLDRAAVQLDQSAHEREADSQATLGAVERRAALHEQVEHEGQDVAGDPFAVVADADLHLLAAVRQDGTHPDVSGMRRELEGIVDEIADHLLQPHRVGEPHHGRRGQLDGDLFLRRVDGRPQRIHRPVHQLAELDPLPLQLDLAVTDARDIQQIVDHAADVTQLAIEQLVRPVPRL